MLEVNRDLNATRKELDDARDEPERLNQEIAAAISAYEETKALLATANETLSEALAELSEAQEQLGACQASSLTTCNAPPTGWPAVMNLQTGQGQFDDRYRLLLLRGERIRRTGADVYRSSGTLTLPPGRWAFAEIGIGGERATGAGNSSLNWQALPESCFGDAAGSWYDAIAVSCEVVLEWTLQSRYPYAALLVLPIDGLLPAEEE